MQFGIWDPAIHETLDGIKRIFSAQKIKPKNFKMDMDTQSASFQGSAPSPYETTLNACTCVDFSRRGLPCKHMYRLAMELGCSDDLPEFNPYRASEYDVEKDISRLKDRWQAGQLTGDAFIKCVDALHKSASYAKRPPGCPKKEDGKTV